MFSFRQKIFITYVLVFLVFIAMMFPFAQRAVKNIAQKAMEDRATELISILKATPNDEALISKIKEQKALVFFRVSVVTNERKLLYDSHTKRLLGPRFSQEYVVNHPEVLRAFREGKVITRDTQKFFPKNLLILRNLSNFTAKPTFCEPLSPWYMSKKSPRISNLAFWAPQPSFYSSSAL
ncbi:MAG: hypothetical protein ACE5GN_04040 [Waddliaceae bacterium]